MQPRRFYPARFSIKIEGQIRSFLDKRSLKQYTSTQLALQEMLNGLLYGQEGQERERERERGTQVEKIAMNNYLT